MQASPSGALAGVERVHVGTLNPAKLRAVTRALARLSCAAPVSGVAAASGVSEQPVGFAEIVRGARSRARAAFAAGGSLGVGIEDGLVELQELGPGEWLNVGCAYVIGAGREGYGLSSGFAYPPELSGVAVADRAPIGDLFDAWWKGRALSETGGRDLPSGRTVGNVGKLTRGALCRDEYAEHAVLCALVRFLHADAYPSSSPEADPRPPEIDANPVRQQEPGAARAAARE